MIFYLRPSIQFFKETFQVCVLSVFLLVRKFLKNLWGLGTEYRNRVVVPGRQAT
jgi:hypothetical protein